MDNAGEGDHVEAKRIDEVQEWHCLGCRGALEQGKFTLHETDQRQSFRLVSGLSSYPDVTVSPRSSEVPQVRALEKEHARDF